MDLRDYQEMPDQGLFEKIQRRLLLRRVAWWTGIVVAVAAVVTVVAILMPGQPSDGVEQTVPVAENTVVAEELQAEPMAMTKEHSLAVVKETVVRVPETAVPATVTIAQEPIAAEAVSVVNLEQNTMVEVETPVSNVSMDIEEKSVVDIETEPVNEAMSNTKAGQSTPEQPHVDNVLCVVYKLLNSKL